MDNQRCQDAQEELTKRSAELTERFAEFLKLHDFILKRAKRWYRFGTFVHLTIIILGAVSASQATVKDHLGADTRSIIVLFSVLAILMTISAGLESFFKWNHKSGAFYSLAALCSASLYKMHDQWYKATSEYTDQPSPSSLRKVLRLADADLETMNSKIVEIHNRAAELGVTDLIKLTSLSPEDMFKVPLQPTRIDPSNNGNGRPAEGKPSSNAHRFLTRLPCRL